MRFTVLFVGLACAAGIAAGCQRDPETLKQGHLSKGDEYAAGKQYDAAIIEYRNALQQDPRFGLAYVGLSKAYLQINDAGNALLASVRAADLRPEDVDVQIQASNLLLLAGRFADARDRAQKILQREPDNVRALVSLGNALAGLKDLDGGIKQIEAAIRLDPSKTGSYTNLGVLQAAIGRPSDAEATYRTAIAASPSDPAPRLALTQLYWFTNRPLEAERALQDALATAPRDVLTNRFAAAFYQATARADRAERHLRAAVDLEGTTSARLTLADFYLANSRPSDAAAVLRQLTDDKTVGHVATIRLAIVDYAEGRTEAAAAAIDGVLAKDRRDVQALLIKSSMLFDQKKYEEALARVNEAVAAEPDSGPARFALGRVLMARHQDEEAKQAFNEAMRLNPRSAGTQIELAKLQLASGAADAAVSLASAATKVDPRRIDARLVLARGLMARGDLIQAETIIRQLAAAAPNAAAVQAQVGSLELRKRNRTAATQAFERALQLDPLQLDAVDGLATLDITAKRPEAASERVGRLIASAPDNPEVQTLAGRVFLITGRTVEAETALRKAVSLDAGALPAYSLLGGLYIRTGRLEDALTEFTVLSERQDRPVAALTMIGLIHQMQDRIVPARAAFERAVGLDPNTPVAANNLAWIYAEHGGNLDVALQLAQAAKAALPRNGEIADTLGWVYLKKELWPLATATLQDAVAADPSNPTFYYHLGLAYQRAGNAADAKRMLTAALAFKRDFPGMDDATRLLSSL